ncbi:RNAbinding protein 45like [Caligus rogercresseyi]|uniref:RNAbinding protein 45like n=1 Tax=Caligus rogercresseyi TaxID=217165 RepID=A0A7T8JYC8_CALRO|nr:RNAbinding protein 45like [Caligus rogercresseyi]
MLNARKRSYDRSDDHSDRRYSGSGGNMNNSSSNSNSHTNNKMEDPPNSRLFIVCGKNISEDQFREAFLPFGRIEEIWMVRDKLSGEPKGVTYIKFSKTSEAALAMEEMNGKVIGGSPRPLKVLIAHSREQGSKREMNEEERLLRLFLVVPKSMSESELKDIFSTYGDIDYASLVRDRSTRESKGYGYVKYHRMSHAAKAFEECDRSFKPVFAEPRPQKGHLGSTSSPSSSSLGEESRSARVGGGGGGCDLLSYMDTSLSNPENLCRLSVIASPTINQDQLWKLFDLIPGLDYCDSRKSRHFSVVYNNPQSATYAKEKLHGFEYPPGHRMVVKFEGKAVFNHNNNNHASNSFGSNRTPSGSNSSLNCGNVGNNNGTNNGGSNSGPNIQNDLAHLTETIANATALLQAAGYSSAHTPSPSSSSETYDPSYCSVKLPPPQPLAAIDSYVEERLFLVCSPTPPQLYALKDVFGRFGNLIDVYMLSGKTCGYAKYAAKASAMAAMAALHGQGICGSRLKVVQADPQKDLSASENNLKRKRAKILPHSASPEQASGTD